MKTLTAAEIAHERAEFRMLGAARFVPEEVARELRILLAIAEVAFRTKHTPPTEWHERTKAALADVNIRCPEQPYAAVGD
jgi:hypothetical protein